ncbi:MAG: molecular chaperone HtpG [Pseudomonadales bacterium]
MTDSPAGGATAGQTSHGFQTEARQLLRLMIHSLYSNREIFLRELISNASDAIDKLRFRALADASLVGDDSDYAVTLEADAQAGTLTIADNGIGMSRQELIEHLGTIARSGTAEFIARLSGEEKKDAALIGQFGVGFYSAFIVADEVAVFSRAAGSEEGWCWRSRAEDTFTIEPAEALPRGTRVVLTLKPDALEFADDWRLRGIVRRYSDHIAVPVRMQKPAAADNDAGVDQPAPEWETVNAAKALWTRSRSEVGDDEYREFYRHISHDFSDPLVWSHNRVEGKLEYTSLLYVPKIAPFELWNRDAPRGLKLYVQRVFIMDEAEQFLPLYLRFVKGVVDSNDLPLNVSREILQQDDRVTTIRNALTKRVLAMLQSMADKPAAAEGEENKTAAVADYDVFWDAFGNVLKEGVGEDAANREALLKLFRFSTTRVPEKAGRVSLDTYLDRMVEGQDRIYFLAADSWEAAKQSPHLEIFRERGIEVLLLHERIDEWMMGNLRSYREKSFQDIARADLVLPGESTPENADDETAEPLAERIAAALDGRVDKVRPSRRLKDSPACLVLAEFDPGPQMRRILEATGQALPESKPQFEYNPDHALIRRLDTEADEDQFRELALVLLDQATLAGGGTLTDPAAYVSRVNDLLLKMLAS